MNDITVEENISKETLTHQQKKYYFTLFVLNTSFIVMLLIILTIAAGVVLSGVIAIAIAAAIAAGALLEEEKVAAGAVAAAGAGATVVAGAAAVVGAGLAIGIIGASAVGVMAIIIAILYFYFSISVAKNTQKQQFKKAKIYFILSALFYITYIVIIVTSLTTFTPKENAINLIQYKNGSTEIITEIKYFQPLWNIKSFHQIPYKGNIQFKNVPENMNIEGTYKILISFVGLNKLQLNFLSSIHTGIDIFQSPAFQTKNPAKKLKELLMKRGDGDIYINIQKLSISTPQIYSSE
jgi:hypothetical protein